MAGAGETAHIEPDLCQDDFCCSSTDAGNAAEQDDGLRPGESGLLLLSLVLISSTAGLPMGRLDISRLLLRRGFWFAHANFDLLADAPNGFIQTIDVMQVLTQQEVVERLELSHQGLFQLRPFGLHAPASQTG